MRGVYEGVISKPNDNSLQREIGELGLIEEFMKICLNTSTIKPVTLLKNKTCGKTDLQGRLWLNDVWEFVARGGSERNQPGIG